MRFGRVGQAKMTLRLIIMLSYMLLEATLQRHMLTDGRVHTLLQEGNLLAIELIGNITRLYVFH
ncbi:hypothetical protein EA457_01450 [Streptococcus dysgalactiae subsp. dysgalactiae]|uniref:Uncharacterized protein n=1 Tax=Streptococcus dysgalactiae subsp. dysgalactiae TaxID=99822 RepID=A0A9X7S7D2_STRDY|nr:hypothetical protein [Streptococcus dysgalactiae subsp. dysgalactiae]QGG97792.1 hypothetical protein EA459_03525 [Streptococcus dysgalactiae subsp. dysgalactiae]QGH01315.1 hypothetical protein EA457_01450 [Streptococcus dysgalactiae subsp. dysgalactiae]